MNIFLQSLYNIEKQRSFTEPSKLFPQGPISFFNMILIRRKIQTLFLRKHAKTKSWGYQQLARYSYDVAGKTFFFFIRKVNNHGINRETVSQILRFISQLSLKVI